MAIIKLKEGLLFNNYHQHFLIDSNSDLTLLEATYNCQLGDVAELPSGNYYIRHSNDYQGDLWELIETDGSGGITPSGTKTINISQSGTNEVDVTEYATAEIVVPGGTEGTPTATKGTVSNHAITVTPGVTNVGGFISGGTHTGTGVSVSASELVSGAKSITANGNEQDVVNYATVNVSVPNSYAAGDEGKVVSSGALVSQTSDTATQNGTVDTTLINSLEVNVPNSYAAGDEGKVVYNGELVAQTSDTVTQNGTVDTTLINELLVNVSGSPDYIEKIMEGQSYTYENDTITSIVGGTWAMYLTSLKIPNCTTLGGDALSKFGGTVLALPALVSVSGYQHLASSKLQILDLGPNFGAIKNMMIQNSANLATLILRRSNDIVSIDSTNELNSNAFKSGGSGGTVYIPKSLYDHLGDGTSLDYKAATNWATVDGYGTITWAAIEGSQYENYYADGTPIT